MTLESSSRYQSEVDWLAQCFDELTDTVNMLTPSAWAEQKRYLPASVTNMPGYYRFDVAPYLKEIVDCLSIDSPVREVSVMKGAQVCATVGILENFIGYLIDVVKSAPCMLITADAELAKLRLEAYIVPMLQFSGLDSLVKSNDENNARKTGRTDKKLEWFGGGFLLPFGAQNANKLRSASIQMLLRDEIDGWPDVVGKDGDPIALSEARTSSYEDSRKIVDLSTPLIKGQSKIQKRYLLGDQRKYFVCCVKCGFSQELRWRRENKDTGEVTGIVWDLDSDGSLIPGSVRYLCASCGHAHLNDDKTRLLAPENGAQWRATATAKKPWHRSYHISALYSPVGMKSWEGCVQDWLEAWDPLASKPRDMAKLQVFYNNVLGEPFELRGGEKVKFETVSGHRRQEYRYGEIPNFYADRYCGGKVALLTCAVDVHEANLAVAVFGWCPGMRAILVDYDRFEGEPGSTERLDDPKTWGRLQELIEQKQYIADDGRKYKIQLALIDAGYRSDTVYRFASEYPAGVFPVKGRAEAPKSAALKEFSPYTTTMGTDAYGITVDIYKDRWSSALRRGWDGMSMQPEPYFNAPGNALDAQLKELTVETKREKIDARTGQRIGWEWHRPNGANNELWDLLVYSNAGLEMIAQNVCVGQMQLKSVDWRLFFETVEKEKHFFTE